MAVVLLVITMVFSETKTTPLYPGCVCADSVGVGRFFSLVEKVLKKEELVSQ